MTTRAMGIEEIRTAPRSPWQNAYAERVIGSIRRECLDHVIVLNEAGLHRVLTAYLAYYHHSQTHLSLAKDPPHPRSISLPQVGPVVAIPEVHCDAGSIVPGFVQQRRHQRAIHAAAHGDHDLCHYFYSIVVIGLMQSNCSLRQHFL